MKDMIKKTQMLYKQSEVMIIQFIGTGYTFISLVQEKKKHLNLFSPMGILRGYHQEDGKEFVKLVPYHSELMVESSNMILRKKDVILLNPSDQFKAHYLARITGKTEKPKAAKKVKEESKETESGNNVVQFSNFRKHQKESSNLTLVSANTESSNTGDEGPHAA
jgi:hypothetical protein